MKNKMTASRLTITLALTALCLSSRAAADGAETSLGEAFSSIRTAVQAGRPPLTSPAARKALVEAELVARRHQLADQVRELESSIAEISAARQVSINETKRNFSKCGLALSDDQVLGHARDIIAVETDYLSENPVWNKLVSFCPWYVIEQGAFAIDMARVVRAHKRIDLKTTTLKSVRDEAAAVEAQIAALGKAR